MYISDRKTSFLPTDMKTSRQLLVPLLFICFVTMLLTSCKKEAETPKAAPNSTALTTQKPVYAPFEVVVIKVPKGTLGLQALEGLLDDQKVRVMVADTVAIFVMPDVANGSHKLALTANGKDYSVLVGVVALLNVQSPSAYFDAIEADVNRNIAAINAQADALLRSGVSPTETQALKQNAQQYAAQFGTYKTAYQNLSAADKQNFARAMAANKPGIDEYQLLTEAAATQANALRGLQAPANYEASVTTGMQTHVVLLTYTLLHIPLIALEANFFLAAPTPFMFVALSITVASFLLNATLARASVGTLFNKSLKPFQNLFVDQTAYDNGLDTPVTVSADYRSLTTTDETTGAGGSVLDAGLAKYKSFRDAFNNLVGQLPSSLRPTPIGSILRAQAATLSRSIFNAYVRVSNVSNPAVTLTQLNQADGSVKVRATTSATTTQNFTYDITYTNSGFSTGLTKRVSAQVTGANPNCNGVPLKITGIKTYLPTGFNYASFGVYGTGGVAPFLVDFYSPCCGGYNSTGSYIGCGGLDGRQIYSPAYIFYIPPGRSIQLTCTVTDAQGTKQSLTTTVTN